MAKVKHMPIDGGKDSLGDFENIKRFFGTDWLEEGCARFQEDIDDMVKSGRVPFQAEERAHPLHQLWHKIILGKSLYTDVVRGSSSLTHRSLGQIHRLLTLEYLLDRLSPNWNDDVAKEIRAKLINRGQFTATLYELEVADNFIRDGFDINFQVAQAGRTADLSGDCQGRREIVPVGRSKTVPLGAVV